MVSPPALPNWPKGQHFIIDFFFCLSHCIAGFKPEKKVFNGKRYCIHHTRSILSLVSVARPKMERSDVLSQKTPAADGFMSSAHFGFQRPP